MTLCLSKVAFPAGDELERSEVGQGLVRSHAVVGFFPAQQLAVQIYQDAAYHRSGDREALASQKHG